MSDPAIRDACAEARSYAMGLAVSPFRPLWAILPDEYMNECQRIFEEAEVYQRRFYRVKPKLLAAPHIREIGEFAKKHNLSASLHGMSYSNSVMFGIRNDGNIEITVLLPFDSPQWLGWTMRHEYGHIRDLRLIAMYAPELKATVKKTIWDMSELRQVTSTILKIMRDGLSESDRRQFDRLQKEVIGSLDHYNVRMLPILTGTLGDLFRGGEEILDERIEDHVMSDAFCVLKKGERSENDYLRWSIFNHKDERVDLHRLQAIAMLQEARLWKKFTQLPDYDPITLRFVKPNHLQFIRLCIRGATRYFINTAAR